jgi:prevent-host-death family protein
MAERTWTVEGAREHLAELLDAAERGEPQRVNRPGHAPVYIVSAADYPAALAKAVPGRDSLVSHILAAPKAPPGIDVDDLFARSPFRDRPDPFAGEW